MALHSITSHIGNSRIIDLSARGLVPVDFYRDPHRHDLLSVLIPHLNRDVAGITLRKLITSDLGRRASGLVFGRIEAVELNTCLIPGEAASVPHVKI